MDSRVRGNDFRDRTIAPAPIPTLPGSLPDPIA